MENSLGSKNNTFIRAKKDHICFAIFLILLLLAPGIPLNKLGFEIIPGLGSLSPGFLGLLIWAFVSPQYFLKIYIGRNFYECLILVLFGVYAFIVSLMSFKTLAILYSLQYLFYLVFGYLLLSSYIKRVMSNNEIRTTINIIAVISTIYSIGVIVSVFTGPIYPYQALFFRRTWGSVLVTQGVGFSDSANGAGVISTMFASLFLFSYRQKTPASSFVKVIPIIAIIMTFSRSAIFGFLISLFLLLAMMTIRVVVSPERSREEFRTVFSFIVIAFILVLLILIVVYLPEMEYLKSFLLGFGISDDEILRANLFTRVELWQAGINNYLSSNFLVQLVGSGFRNSDYIDVLGAWITSHNFYINALGDFGIIGTSLFIIPFIIFLGKSINNILTGENFFYKSSFVALTTLLIMNMNETFFYSPGLITMVLLFLLLPNTFTSES